MPYSNINSAYYGKNFTKGRQWTYEEMKNKGSWISEISNRVSSIARQGQDLERLDFYDGLDKRLNKVGVKKTYDEYAYNIKTHKNTKICFPTIGFYRTYCFFELPRRILKNLKYQNDQHKILYNLRQFSKNRNFKNKD